MLRQLVDISLALVELLLDGRLLLSNLELPVLLEAIEGFVDEPGAIAPLDACELPLFSPRSRALFRLLGSDVVLDLLDGRLSLGL